MGYPRTGDPPLSGPGPGTIPEREARRQASDCSRGYEAQPGCVSGSVGCVGRSLRIVLDGVGATAGGR